MDSRQLHYNHNSNNGNNYTRYQRNINCMNVFIPGLQNPIDIPFPDHKLPVCMQCKSMFKSRNQCRLQNGHTDVAWNTSYVCVILDESCYTKNSHGGAFLVEENTVHFTAQLISGPPVPLQSKNGDLGGTKSPFCMACKDKNYTRYHCRGMKNHQMLPFLTVYVLLSAVARIPGSDRLPVRNICNDIIVRPRRSASDISMSSSCPIERCSDEISMKKVKIDKCTNSTINVVSSAKVESDDIQKIEPSKASRLTIARFFESDTMPVHNSHQGVRVKQKISSPDISTSLSYPIDRCSNGISMENIWTYNASKAISSKKVEADDIRKIESSKAFLLTIGNDHSCKLRVSVQWL